MRDTELAKAATDVSIVAVVVVLAVIIIVVVTVYIIVRFLRGVVDGAGKHAPPAECTVWLELRRQRYRGAANCEAAGQAVLDAQEGGSGGACPVVAAQQHPYLAYMAARQCPAPPS